MDYFIQFHEIAFKESDYGGEIFALNNIATLCSYNNQIDKAIQYTQRAYNIACQTNDSLRIGLTAMNIASYVDDIELAEKYVNIAINMLQNKPYTLDFKRAQMVYIENLYQKKLYNEAEKLALSLLDEISLIKHDSIVTLGTSYKDDKPLLLLSLSKIYQKKGDIDKATYYAKQVLINNPDLKKEIEAYQQLVILSRGKQEFDLAFQYKDSVIAKKDSLHKIILNNNIESNRVRFDLLNSEKKLAENKAKQKAERLLFIFILIFVITLAVILIWIFRIRSIKNKQQKIILENEQKITKLELQQQKNEKLILEQELVEKETLALLKQEQLNNEIEIKNKQLIARVLFQTNRSNLIKELIAAFPVTIQKENPVLESIIQKLKLQLKDSAYANNFLEQLEQINPSLLSLIKEKHPTLSIDEIQILSYTYLYNTKTKKIASLLDISVNTCQKRKERVAAKIGIKTDELYAYLQDLMNTAIADTSGGV